MFELIGFAAYVVSGVVFFAIPIARWFVRYTEREYPTLGWDREDTFMTVIVSFFSILFWPAIVMMIIVWALTILPHHGLTNYFNKQRESNKPKITTEKKSMR